MLNERQRRAWDELALGPEWVRRAGGAAAQDLLDPLAAGTVPVDAEDAGTLWQQSTARRFELPVPGEVDAGTAGSAGNAGNAGSAPVPGDAIAPVAVADTWAQVAQEVSGCRKCGLCESRSQTVFGSGPYDARWMLIGEAPGAEEDARGEPFVGQAGRLLDQMLLSIGLSRPRDVFITNVLKCRPPGNRNPEPLEAATCAPYLYRQIDLLQPDLILLLGRFAVQSVLKTEASVGGLRRQVHRYAGSRGDIPVVCTYHPAYLLRNPIEKKKTWEDLCFALDLATRQQGAREGRPQSP